MNQEDYKEMLERQQVEAVKKATLLRFMTKSARERLNRVKIVKPELAEKVEMALIQALQLGRIKDRLSDAQLKEILIEASNKKDFNLKIYKK